MKKIRNIMYVASALLVGCSAEENLGSSQTTQEDRMPLHLEATLSTGHAVTRAANMDFAEGDQLLAYLRHTTGGSLGSYTTTLADQAPLLVTFTVGDNEMTTVNATTKKTSDLTPGTPLYWDDFSDARNAATDLHTSGHGLQTYYGYCYNGGTPQTALTEATGVLGWSVGAVTAGTVNQNSADAIRHADLLWSREQTAIEYAQLTAREGVDHGTLSIPYTHAMSEVTVILVAGEGFSTSADEDPLANAMLTLNQMNTVASLTAPTAAVTASGTPADIIMYGEEPYLEAGVWKRKYTAIVAPDTKLKKGVKLLDITNVEDNYYSLSISGTGEDEMLAATAWQAGHTLKTDDGNYILTQPGFNYMLTITVNKTKIEVEAKITDWQTVNASGTAVIDLIAITPNGLTGDDLTDGTAIKVFQLKHDDTSDAASERTNVKYGSPVTTATYSAAGDGSWTYDPNLFWPNKTDQFYFRAMTQETAAVSQGTAAEKDVLWATTTAHGTGPNDYAEGAAIGPRTNEVPLAFEHAMSKVTFILETTGDEDDTTTPTYGVVDHTHSKADLRNAAIAISNLYTNGTISIEDGSIAPSDNHTDDGDGPADGRTIAAISGTATNANQVQRLTVIDNYVVIPQTIADDAFVTITLRDPSTEAVVATYRLQLNLCEDASNNTIGAWQRGQHYTYTIHIEKEQITFRALVKDWDEKAGSGNANLEWDD